MTEGEPEATELLEISITVVVTSELVYSAVAWREKNESTRSASNQWRFILSACLFTRLE